MTHKKEDKSWNPSERERKEKEKDKDFDALSAGDISFSIGLNPPKTSSPSSNALLRKLAEERSRHTQKQLNWERKSYRDTQKVIFWIGVLVGILVGILIGGVF